jgi:predicted nucleic acid-binding protein
MRIVSKAHHLTSIPNTQKVLKASIRGAEKHKVIIYDVLSACQMNISPRIITRVYTSNHQQWGNVEGPHHIWACGHLET